MVSTVDNYIWPVTIPEDGMANAMGPWPGRVVGSAPSAAVYDGFGEPNWTGNFTLNYPLDSVNSIEVVAKPFTADEYSYYLVEGVDFIVHADDDLIELVTPVDVPIINEHWKDGVNNSLGGWPWIGHLATGIESVFVDMNNGTARFGRNLGYAVPPPSEWWYDPDWPWELEGWWALGYFPGAFNWPPGSDWWINYTAASYLNVNYNVEPVAVFVDYDGSYADFLAVTDPWHWHGPRSG
jgi:hypothetical protein